MKIGFITPEYPHPKVIHAAGIGTSIKNLIEALVKKEVKVFIFVYNQESQEIISSDGVEIHLIKFRKYKYLGWFLHRKYIQNYINTIVKNEQIDILEAPDWTGITAFMNFKTPLIIRFHGSDAYFCKLEGRKQKYKNFLFEKKALKNATAFIAPTQFAGDLSCKIFGLDAKKIKTIHHGLQLEKFSNGNPKNFNQNTILYIGTIIRKKGVFELAHIFNKIIESNPKAQLVIIGSDVPDIKTGASSTYALVEKLLSIKSKENIRYLGKVPYKQVIENIKAAHVCVFPSFAETLGMVTIESMALNKPVVNTSIGWAQELIDDGINGFLAHPSNIEDFSNTILSLLNNKGLSIKIGEAARQKVKTNFNIETIANLNIAYYNTIINKRFMW